MTTSPRQNQSAYSLHTLGAVELTRTDSVKVESLRKKDLALLIYLCVEGRRAHSRVSLSSLLWGDHAETRARHSLTQAIGRVRRALHADAVLVRSDQIEWRGPLDCDACNLERAYLAPDRSAPDVSYEGDFLGDFRPGLGAEEFEMWAEQRRLRYRSMALHVLESRGAAAESSAHWLEALEYGRRTVEIESLYEEGHRRIMRAWSALSERGLALRHYNELALWLDTEHGLQPDPATTQLAAELSNELQENGNGHARTYPLRIEVPGQESAEDRIDRVRGSASAQNGAEPSRAGMLMRVLRAIQRRALR